MISVIFRAVLILMVIAIVLAVIVNTGGFFGLTFNFATNEFLKSLLSVVCYIQNKCVITKNYLGVVPT